jgi:hypothetical protein
MKERQSEEQNLHDTTWLSWWCSNAFKSLLLLLLLCGRSTVLRRRLSLHDGSSLSSLAIHSVISAFSLPFIPVSINRSTGRRNPLLLFSASGSHCLLLSLSRTPIFPTSLRLVQPGKSFQKISEIPNYICRIRSSKLPHLHPLTSVISSSALKPPPTLCA